MPQDKNAYKKTETYKRWDAVRQESPSKAYGLIAIALTKMGLDAAKSGMQSIGNAIAGAKETATSSTNAISEKLNTLLEDVNHHNPTSDKFRNSDVRELENDFKN